MRNIHEGIKRKKISFKTISNADYAFEHNVIEVVMGKEKLRITVPKEGIAQEDALYEALIALKHMGERIPYNYCLKGLLENDYYVCRTHNEKATYIDTLCHSLDQAMLVALVNATNETNAYNNGSASCTDNGAAALYYVSLGNEDCPIAVVKKTQIAKYDTTTYTIDCISEMIYEANMKLRNKYGEYVPVYIDYVFTRDNELVYGYLIDSDDIVSDKLFLNLNDAVEYADVLIKELED